MFHFSVRRLKLLFIGCICQVQCLLGQDGGPGHRPLPDSLIVLSDADVFEEEGIDTSAEFLRASRDLFLNRAAFDFSTAFFRVRGYDSRYGRVYLNGLPMNRFYDGRPQWNNWGGLNDVTRGQEHEMGPVPQPGGFGALQGSTRIDISPERVREGLRITWSSSNRAYRNRLMATYNTGFRDHGWGLLFSASGRQAGESYMEGTPYDAFSFLTGVGYKPSAAHELMLMVLLASNRRGRSAALTREVLSLAGRSYNPYWGFQDGTIRNSRIRFIREPMISFRYRYRGNRFSATFASGYQWGKQYRTRLGYFNAPNPDPIYYRNLPSFYWNQSFGPNLMSADLARRAFMESPQIQWDDLYAANRNGRTTQSAAYIQLSDFQEQAKISANTFFSAYLSKRWQLRAGILYQDSRTDWYARLDDLLGAPFHTDRDPFTQTRNDLDGPLQKGEGDRIGYHYLTHTTLWDGFLSLEADYAKWNAYLSGRYAMTSFGRTGRFRNERYPHKHKEGKDVLSLLAMGIGAGGRYQVHGRHWLQVNTVLMEMPPALRHLYINPRERADLVPGIIPEKVISSDISYYFRGPVVSSRISAYHTRITERTEVRNFFTDSGFGSGFVNEVVRGIDVLHRGLEAGLEISLSPSIEVTGVVAVGDHRYAANPEVSLYFLPGSGPGDLDEEGGHLSLGHANIKGLHIAAGPARAFSIGLHYRAPGYWWAGLTTNYLGKSYMNLALIRYTDSFRMDPDTGLPLTDLAEEDLQGAFAQRSLPPAYLLNLNGGKSWRLGRHYISLFLGISNLFDGFFLSGGFLQSRNGNYRQWRRDHLSGKPSFGPKYWPGAGRTYFINLSWNLQ